MVDELVETKLKEAKKWQKGDATQTAKFVSKMSKLSECEGGALAHVHVKKGTPRHEVEVVEHHMTDRIVVCKGSGRERDN